MSQTQAEAAVEAVQRLQRGLYKATALKVEFEAHLGREYGDWDDESTCQDWFIEHLEPLGLSKDGVLRYPLTYAEFYNDGSVDSEFTFTLSIKEPENVLLLPKLIDLWNEFCHQVTDNVRITGAGMHMAVLNDPKCYYPSVISRSNQHRFVNFKKSMELLLPALYFLATHNATSRALEYRRPEIAMSGAAHGHSKFNAITYKDGALEFRVFDTCYHTPSAILDNVIVIANCLKYWTDAYTPTGLGKLAKACRFGNEANRELKRFYQERTHIDLLNEGLRRIKPAYRTITALKQERGFKLTKTELKQLEKSTAADLELAYKEYEERQATTKIDVAAYERRTRLEMGRPYGWSDAQCELYIKQQVKSYIQRNRKLSLSEFIQQARTSMPNRFAGQYTLRAYE